MNRSDTQASIAILLPYFGDWPFWIELFIASCRKNPSIDFYFFSDCGRLESFPDNVKYQEISFDEYKALVSEKLGIIFNPVSAYKLCDLKPAYGFIHEDVVRGYDFFGFGDLDLVYGDLRKLYTREDLRRYDLISNHATRVSGHLTLIRNTKKMSNAFRRISGWQSLLASDEHLAVDEKAFSRLFVKHKNFPCFLRPLCNLFYPLARRSKFVERYTTPNGYVAWRDGSYDFPEEWFWRNGVISNSLDSEGYYPYFHFLVWKENWTEQKPWRVKRTGQEVTYFFSASGIRERWMQNE